MTCFTHADWPPVSSATRALACAARYFRRVARSSLSWPWLTISPWAFNSQNWKERSLKSSPMVNSGSSEAGMIFFFMAGLLFAPLTECVLFPPASLPPLDGGQPAHPICPLFENWRVALDAAYLGPDGGVRLRDWDRPESSGVAPAYDLF